MKMNRFVMMSASLCILAPIFSQAKPTTLGDENRELGLTLVEQVVNHPNQVLKDCTDVQLDPTQTAALKQAEYEYMKQKNTLGAAEKNAWIDYAYTLADMTSTKDQGTAAASGVKDSVSASLSAKSDFELKVFYDILKPEQRESALKCIMAAMKQKMQDDLRKMCALLPPAKPTP